MFDILEMRRAMQRLGGSGKNDGGLALALQHAPIAEDDDSHQHGGGQIYTGRDVAML